MRESIMINRRYSHPSEVTKVSGKRIYMRRPHRNKDGVIEDYTEKHGNIDLVKAVFRTEADAWEAYEIDKKLTLEYETRRDELYREMNARKDLWLADLKTKQDENLV